MQEEKKENDCLWMLKGISCIIVILFHCPIKGILGDGIIYALRFPIPIFFMSTGYFIYRNSDYLSKVTIFFKYLVFGEIIAFISLILKALIDGSLYSFLNTLNLNISLKTLFFGYVFNGTLWYLYAMIWTFMLLLIISRYRYGFRVGYCMIIPLLFLHIVGRVYITNNYDINELVFIFRSSLLFAFPFILIGRLIAEVQDEFKKYLNYFSIGGIFCFGIALMFFEYFRWHRFMDLQVSTIFISISLFLFTLYRPDVKFLGFFKYIGKNLLLYVYIFHIPVYNIVQALYRRVKIENNNFVPLIVVVFTLIFSFIWGKASKRMKMCKQ